MGGSIQMRQSITGGCEMDVGRTTADIGPKKGENPEYLVLTVVGLTCKRADTREESSRGGGVDMEVG